LGRYCIDIPDIVHYSNVDTAQRIVDQNGWKIMKNYIESVRFTFTKGGDSFAGFAAKQSAYL
jgi:hypothetical protein